MSGHDPHDDTVRRLRASLDRRAADLDVTPGFADRVQRQRRHREATNRIVGAAATTLVVAVVAVLGVRALPTSPDVEFRPPRPAVRPSTSEAASPIAPSEPAAASSAGPTGPAAPAAPAQGPGEGDAGADDTAGSAGGTAEDGGDSGGGDSGGGDGGAPAQSGGDRPADGAATAVADLATARVAPGSLPGQDYGPWVVVDRSTRPRPSADLFDPCDPTAYPTDAQRDAVATNDLRQDAPEGDALEQNITRYRSAAVAAEALAGFRRVIAACDGKAIGGGQTRSVQILDDAGDRVLVSIQEGDLPMARHFVVLDRRGDVLALSRFWPSHGGSVQGARAVADLAAGALAAGR